MIWSKEPGILEYGILILFLILYIGFFIRIWLIARQVKSDFLPIFLKFFLRSFYIFLLILALLGPSFGDIKKEVKTVSKDIFFVIDVSTSMNANDLSPTRLEFAKHTIAEALPQLDADRIGFIIFTTEAFVHCPLTHDQNAQKLFLESITGDMISDGGTDLEKSLNLVLREFSQDDNKTEKSLKIAVIVSDGEQQTVVNPAIAQILKKNDISIFTLGTGTKKGGKIPVPSGFKKDLKGQTVVTRLQPSTLKELARVGGGKYYEITESNNETNALVGYINKMKGKVRDLKKLDAAANKYYYFVLFALILVICDLLLTVRTVRI